MTDLVRFTLCCYSLLSIRQLFSTCKLKYDITFLVGPHYNMFLLHLHCFVAITDLNSKSEATMQVTRGQC